MWMIKMRADEGQSNVKMIVESEQAMNDWKSGVAERLNLFFFREQTIRFCLERVEPQTNLLPFVSWIVSQGLTI
jgi:hypothetical protein